MSKKDAARPPADPAAAFGDPRALLEDDTLADADKVRILLDWRQDLLELQTAGAENMPNQRGESNVADRLQAVSNALIALGYESD